MLDLDLALPETITTNLVALFEAGEWAALERAARLAITLYPRHLLGWRALGKALLRLDNMEAATKVLSRLLELAPLEADAHNDLGFALFSQGRNAEAEASYRRALELDPRLAEAHSNLGIVLHQLGQFPDAVACHRNSLAINPGSATTYSNLGAALRENGQLQEAERSFRQAVALDPRLFLAHINLGRTLFDLRQFQEAATCYQQALALAPDSAVVHTLLGVALRDLGRHGEAETSFRRSLAIRPDALDTLIYLGGVLESLGRLEEAIATYKQALQVNSKASLAYSALGRLLDRLGGPVNDAMLCLKCAFGLNPDDPDVCIDLGNILMRDGQTDEALSMFRRAQERRPLITWRADQATSEFSVVFLDTPMAGSTPVNYLAGRASYDRHFHCVIPDALEDIALLRAKGDVVFNMICNADDGATTLPLAADLADRIDRPTVNHPRLVMHTNRETIARRLTDIHGCVVPSTRRVAGAELIEAAARGEFEAFRLPLLVRRAGPHGGDDFEKCANWAAVADFVTRRPAAHYYLIEYLDYRSVDELFRKYRVIYIDGEILPYHLAIHDDWKVHHFRTDMANQSALRAEEERFLSDMSQVFDAAAQATLREIGAATGLDYCGIDCGLDRDGRIVVFEANAAMLVHDETSATFAYKNQYIARIKQAFDAMLARRRLMPAVA